MSAWMLLCFCSRAKPTITLGLERQVLSFTPEMSHLRRERLHDDDDVCVCACVYAVSMELSNTRCVEVLVFLLCEPPSGANIFRPRVNGQLRLHTGFFFSMYFKQPDAVMYSNGPVWDVESVRNAPGIAVSSFSNAPTTLISECKTQSRCCVTHVILSCE